MRKNDHTGTVYLSVGDGEVALRYDWEAIADLHGTYGKEWEGEVNRIITELDSRGLAAILAMGSEHPVEWWMERSPAFVPIAQAVQKALHLAFFGAGEIEARPSLARQLLTLFSKAGESGSNSAGDPQTSGATPRGNLS